jgi:hypothetical protein
MFLLESGSRALVASLARMNCGSTARLCARHADIFNIIYHAVEGFQKRGLAATGRSDDAGNFAVGQHKVDIFKDMAVFNADIERLHLKLGFAALPHKLGIGTEKL